MSSCNSYCTECWNKIIGDWYQSKNHLGLICLECKIKENIIMPNIKITAEVDGKQVPLETVSTETFEAIKALEKPKEIPVPVARLTKFNGWPRLIFRPTKNMQLKVGRVYALALDYGNISADWTLEDDDSWIEQYKDIKPL